MADPRVTLNPGDDSRLRIGNVARARNPDEAVNLALLNDNIQVSATEPVDRVDGTLWVDTSVNPNVLRIYDGTTFVEYEAGSGGGNYFNIPATGRTEDITITSGSIVRIATTPQSDIDGIYLKLDGADVLIEANTDGDNSLRTFVTTPTISFRFGEGQYYNVPSLAATGRPAFRLAVGDTITISDGDNAGTYLKISGAAVTIAENTGGDTTLAAFATSTTLNRRLSGLTTISADTGTALNFGTGALSDLPLRGRQNIATAVDSNGINFGFQLSEWTSAEDYLAGTLTISSGSQIFIAQVDTGPATGNATNPSTVPDASIWRGLGDGGATTTGGIRIPFYLSTNMYEIGDTIAFILGAGAFQPIPLDPAVASTHLFTYIGQVSGDSSQAESPIIATETGLERVSRDWAIPAGAIVEFNSGFSYHIGSYVTYNQQLYRATADIFRPLGAVNVAPDDVGQTVWELVAGAGVLSVIGDNFDSADNTTVIDLWCSCYYC